MLRRYKTEKLLQSCSGKLETTKLQVAALLQSFSFLPLKPSEANPMYHSVVDTCHKNRNKAVENETVYTEINRK